LKEKVSGFWMEGERWIPTFVGMTFREVGMTFREVGMTETSNEIGLLSPSPKTKAGY
jgi:hypothetical protein